MPAAGAGGAGGAASLQYSALDFPAFLLHVAVGGAVVVRLARPDLAHEVEEHLRPDSPSTPHERTQPQPGTGAGQVPGQQGRMQAKNL